MFTLKKNEENFVTMKWYIENLKNIIKMPIKEMQHLETYNNQELEKVIIDVIDNISIGTIAITEDYYLMEGRKRILAINSFIDGKIKWSGKYYDELTDEEKEKFCDYYLPVFLG